MSGVIPSLSPKEVASTLERLGFTGHRQRGGHNFYVKDDHQVTVPFNTEDRKNGTLHQIIKGNHGYEPQSKLWKQIPQQAAGYYTLRYAGLFNLPIPLRRR
jgi:predicted RNA binding protein YcfA (HicA-like mRNA interferase family)